MISMYDVLLATSNIPVDDPIAEIWGRQMQGQGGYEIVEYTGTLPITINADGGVLIDYRIYGNTIQNGTPTPENPIIPEGVGEPTENLFNEDDVQLISVPSGARYGTPMNLEAGNYTFTAFSGVSGGYIYAIVKHSDNRYSTDFYIIVGNVKYTRTIPIASGDTLYIYNASGTGTEAATKSLFERGQIVLVKGSTAPTSYIPYGYKLPMTVYKQEFMVMGDMLDQSNWVLSSSQWYASYFMYFDISDLISKEECVAKIYENFSAMYTPEKLVVALTDDMYALVDAKYRILNNYSVILNRKFDFSSWDKIYLCIGHGDGFSDNAIKQSKIDELFENWKILIAPTSQTRESPVYIGENQLGEDEYVSFSDQKIYKDVSGTLTPTEPPVLFPEIPTIDGTTVIDYDGDPKPSQMYVKYKSKSGGA